MAPPSVSGMKRGPHGTGTMTPPQPRSPCGRTHSRNVNVAGQPDPKTRRTLAEKAGTEFPNASTKSTMVAPTPSRNMIRGTSLKDMLSVSNNNTVVGLYAHFEQPELDGGSILSSRLHGIMRQIDPTLSKLLLELISTMFFQLVTFALPVSMPKHAQGLAAYPGQLIQSHYKHLHLCFVQGPPANIQYRDHAPLQRIMR